MSVCAHYLTCGGIKNTTDVVGDLNRIQLPGLNQHFGFGCFRILNAHSYTKAMDIMLTHYSLVLFGSLH